MGNKYRPFFFHCRCYFLFSFHVRTYPPRSGLSHFNTCSPTLNGPRLMRFCHLLPLFYLISHVRFSSRVSKDARRRDWLCVPESIALLWPQLLKQKIHLQCFEGRGRAMAEISQWGLSDAPLPQSEWPVWQPPVHIAPENAHTSRKDVRKVLELWHWPQVFFWVAYIKKWYFNRSLSQILRGTHYPMKCISDVSVLRNNQVLPLKSITLRPSNKRDQRRQSPVSWA